MQETILYSLKTALIGMTIVFAFLAFLSFLMWVIKEAFTVRIKSSAKSPRAERAEGAERSSAPDAPGASTTAPASISPDPPSWLIPAAVAFMTLEEDEKSCTAAPWRPSAAENLHTWLSSGGQER